MEVFITLSASLRSTPRVVDTGVPGGVQGHGNGTLVSLGPLWVTVDQVHRTGVRSVENYLGVQPKSLSHSSFSLFFALFGVRRYS